MPGAVALGPALLVIAWWGPERLLAGGIAPVVVAVAVAGFLGVPLALREWRLAEDAATPSDTGVRALADLWGVLLVAAAAAPLVSALGRWGLIGAVIAWWLAAAASRGAYRVAVPLLAALVFGALALDAGRAVAIAPPWTLLEPWWSTWRGWLPAAVFAGFLLPAAGVGQWLGSQRAAPGRRNLPWGVAGLATLAWALASVRHGATFEALSPLAAPSGAWRIVWAGSLVAASVAVLSRGAVAPRALRHGAVGAVATAFFVGPARDALPLWWGTLAPLGVGVFAAWVALRSRGSDRFAAGAGALVLAASAILGFPGLPAQGLAAAAAATIVVVAVWTAGTRVILEQAR